MGYTPSTAYKDRISAARLQYDFEPANITKRCSLTLDPCVSFTGLKTLEKGDRVTFLTVYENIHGRWAYVETYVDGKPARGFVDASCIDMLYMEQDEPSFASLYEK
ncbi:MAG: hypothetical protein FWF47_07470 [Clostridia bacterium]|nr:hypothetical protein [Clostridia bacterium]